MSFDASESSIVHGFQAFYYELLRQKEKALSLYFAQDVESDDSDAGVEGGVVEIQKKLISVIEKVTEMMLAKSRINPRFITDAKYLMAALTDEIFLNLRWSGVKFWRFTLLEKQLFQTEIAGDKIFSMLDEIITDLNNEEMAFLYLMVLSLGFRGKYRDNPDDRVVWYRDRLRAILNSRVSGLFFPGRSHLIEGCYESTFLENSNDRLPDARFWSLCVISIIFLYIIISYFIWNDITGEISDIISRISEQVRQGPLI